MYGIGTGLQGKIMNKELEQLKIEINKELEKYLMPVVLFLAKILRRVK